MAVCGMQGWERLVVVMVGIRMKELVCFVFAGAGLLEELCSCMVTTYFIGMIFDWDQDERAFCHKCC